MNVNEMFGVELLTTRVELRSIWEEFLEVELVTIVIILLPAMLDQACYA